MASPATAQTTSLQPADWIRAASTRLSEEGIGAVRVEVLARDLGVSKGSFYWHFRDRGELLREMLARWEEGELGWLNTRDRDLSAATRWARLIERTADPAHARTETAMRAWARRDENVARRIAAIEERRASVIAEVLRDVGFSVPAAESWSEIVLLICLGWIDRTTRDPQFQFVSRGLGELLSNVILAASARSAALNR